jgi:hypothetical protein
MASPRERDHRAPSRSPDGRSRPRGEWHSAHPPVVHRPYFHDDAPAWPQQRYHDYVYVDRWGWWPRWFPYWDQRWSAYWSYLYDYYGGDAHPEYAAYARDAVLRQYAPQWGLVVGGSWMGADPQEGMVVRDHRGGGMIVRDHRGGGAVVRPSPRPSPVHTPPVHMPPVHMPPVVYTPPVYTPPVHTPPVHTSPPEYHEPHRPRHEHPHYHYRDYVVVDRYWWPRWFPYWDPAWYRYWWQLYHYYGGDAYPDYALYAVDATLRALAQRVGWL